MPREVRDLAQIIDVLDTHPIEAQQRMVQYLVGKYGLMPTLTRSYERQRKADQRFVPDNVPDTLPDIVPPSETHSPTPPVVKPLVSKLLSELQLEASRKKLDKADFEFLAACPEPFRTQWLVDPEWWISLKDGYPRLNHQQEASRCMGWIQSKGFSPAQMQRLNLRRRLRAWFAKGEWMRENREERKAFRR